MEEDIKILEEFIEGEKAFGEYEGNKYFKSIENLIARYKDLEKNYINPNKARISYFDKGKGTEVVIEGFISKSKVQEKIEELKKYGNNLTEEQRQKETEFLQGKLKAYEELLED